MSAIRKAMRVANAAFDAYLVRTRCTASFSVPGVVIEAAKAAFAAAGGDGQIEVIGRGNVSCPVCSIIVRRVKARR